MNKNIHSIAITMKNDYMSNLIIIVFKACSTIFLDEDWI